MDSSSTDILFSFNRPTFEITFEKYFDGNEDSAGYVFEVQTLAQAMATVEEATTHYSTEGSIDNYGWSVREPMTDEEGELGEELGCCFFKTLDEAPAQLSRLFSLVLSMD